MILKNLIRDSDYIRNNPFKTSANLIIFYQIVEINFKRLIRFELNHNEGYNLLNILIRIYLIEMLFFLFNLIYNFALLINTVNKNTESY